MASRVVPSALAGGEEARRDDRTRGRPGHPWPAPLRAFVVALTTLYLLYLVAANLLLATPRLRALVNGDPYATAIRYGSAWTVVPGHVEVTEFSLRFQDHNVQILLELERARVRIDLVALASKRFHVTRLRAEGTSLRVRLKEDSAAGRESRLAAYAGIPGFDDPPVRTPRDHVDAAASATTPPRSELWTLHIEDVAATVRELWIAEIRWVGDGDVRGAFRLAPMRELDVWPSQLRLADGEVTVGGGVVLHAHRSAVDAEVHHVDTRVPRGAEILRFVDGRLQLRGVVASLGPLAALHAAPALVVGGDVGELDVDATLARGVLVQGSAAFLSLAEARLGAREGYYRGPVTLHVDAEATPRVAFVARSTSGVLEVAKAGAPEPTTAAEVQDAFARVRLDVADLLGLPTAAEALSRVRDAGVEIQGVRVADLGALGPLAPRGVVLEGGEAVAAARARLDEKGLVGRVDASLRQGRVRFDALGVTTSGKVWVNVASSSIASGLAFPGSGADLSSLAFATAGRRTEPVSLAARVKQLSFAPTTSAFTAAGELRAAPGARVLAAAPVVAGSSVQLPPWLARAAAGPEATAALRLARSRDGRLDLHVDDARDGAVRVRGLVRDDDRRGARGALLFEAGPLRAGVAFPDGTSGRGSEIVPLVGEEWLAERVRTLP